MDFQYRFVVFTDEITLSSWLPWVEANWWVNTKAITHPYSLICVMYVCVCVCMTVCARA